MPPMRAGRLWFLDDSWDGGAVIRSGEGAVVFAAGVRLHRSERLIWRYFLRADVVVAGDDAECGAEGHGSDGAVRRGGQPSLARCSDVYVRPNGGGPMAQDCTGRGVLGLARTVMAVVIRLKRTATGEAEGSGNKKNGGTGA